MKKFQFLSSLLLLGICLTSCGGWSDEQASAHINLCQERAKLKELTENNEKGVDNSNKILDACKCAFEKAKGKSSDASSYKSDEKEEQKWFEECFKN